MNTGEDTQLLRNLLDLSRMINAFMLIYKFKIIEIKSLHKHVGKYPYFYT